MATPVTPWALWRLGMQGRTFLIGHYATLHDARQALAQYQSPDDSPRYWIEQGNMQLWR